MLKRIFAIATLAGTLAGTAFADQYDKPGFVTRQDDGRLWVFKSDSPALATLDKNGFPEKRALRIGAGPEGMTLVAPDDATIEAYLNGTAPAATTATP